MKITYLALHLGYGGVERSIIDRANLLSSKYEVTILCSYKILDKPAFELSPNVKVKYLTDLKPNKEKVKNALKKGKIISIIKECLYAFKVLYYRKKSMIEEVKDIEAGIVISSRLLFNDILGKYGSKSLIKIAEEHNNHNDNMKYVRSVVKSLKNIDYFLPVSNSLVTKYSKYLDKDKIKFIPHFVDLDVNKKNNLNTNTIISVGRFSKEKGFIDLIRVFSKIENKSIKLIIAGDGEEYSSIKDEIKKYDLQDRVELLGFLEPKLLKDAYEKASLYVMTSYEESFGLVLIEAMNYGIPCVAFDSAKGATEIIKNEYNGYLVDNRDLTKMAGIIDNYFIYDDKEQLSTNCLLTAKEYSKSNIESIWFDFIKEVSDDK